MPSATSSPGQPCRPHNTPAPSCLKASGSSQEGVRPGTFRSRVAAAVSEGRVVQRAAQPGKSQGKVVSSPVGCKPRCAKVTSLGKSAPLDPACPPCWGSCCCSPASGASPWGSGQAQACRSTAHLPEPGICWSCVLSAFWCWALSQGLPSRSWSSRRSQGLWETLPPASLEASPAGHCSGTASGGIWSSGRSKSPRPEMAGESP